MTEYTNHMRPRLDWERLGKREAEAAKWIARGYDDREVAEVMGLMLSTVQAHAKHIYKKLEIRGRSQMSYYAMRDGVLPEANRQ